MTLNSHVVYQKIAAYSTHYCIFWPSVGFKLQIQNGCRINQEILTEKCGTKYIQVVQQKKAYKEYDTYSRPSFK